MHEDITRDLHDRVDWIDKRTISIEEWLIPDKGTKNYPWRNASNITPPLIAKAVRTVWPRIVNAFFAAEPFVHVLPVDPQNRQDAEAREAFLNYLIKNEIPNFQREISTWFLDHVVHGSSALMIYWDQSREMCPEYRIVEAFGQNASGGDVRLTDREILEDMFEDLRRAKPLGNHTYSVTFGEDGFPYDAKVTIDRADPQVREYQASVTIEREFVEGNINIHNVDIEDLITPGTATGYQKEESHHLFRTFWLYPEDIQEKIASGEFFNLKDIDATKMALIRGDSLDHDLSIVKKAKDSLEGVQSIAGLSGAERNQLRVVECYYPWVVNGVPTQMIFYWIPAIKKLAGWEYHSVKFGHGRRPFVILPFLPIANRAHGIGLADMLDPLQQEAATIFNQMNDRENLTNNPVMLVEHNAGVNPNVFNALPPGSVVPVRNVERVRPLEWAKDPHSGLPIFQNLMAFAEQLAGVGDIQAGVQPTRPNAPRTARGTLALISEGNIILDTHIMIAQETFKEVLHQIDGLLRQYMPPERQFPITGREEPGFISQQNFRSRVKFFFTGNTVNTNIQQKQQTAQLLLQSLISHPFFTGQFIQMPPLAIEASWRLINYFAEQHLPGKDATFFFPGLDEVIGYAEQVQQAQNQAQEQARQEAAAAQDQQIALAREDAEAERTIDVGKILADFAAKQSATAASVHRAQGNGRESS